jgi:hypothetical protein
MDRAWTTDGRTAPRTTESITDMDCVAFLESICNAAGFATNHKRVLTSAGNRCADLEIRNIRVAQQTYLLVDVTLRHDYIGAGHSGQNQGQLRNPDNPDHVAFLPACMSTSGRIHGNLLRWIFFLSNKQADDYLAALDYQPHKHEFITVAASSSSKTGGCLVVLKYPKDHPRVTDTSNGARGVCGIFLGCHDSGKSLDSHRRNRVPQGG